MSASTPATRARDEWHYMVRAAGTHGLFWALLKLLLKKRVVTIEEFQDELRVEVVDQADRMGKCG